MFKVIARTVITGQACVELQRTDTGYTVMYGLEHTPYDTIKQALNGFNQCCLHAETCAGFHDEEAE